MLCMAHCPCQRSRVGASPAARAPAAQAPDAELLQEFLGRLPLIFNVAILSPHGFFGQKDVLGKPDTGGQVRARARLATGRAARAVRQGWAVGQLLAWCFLFNFLFKIACLMRACR